MASISLAVIKRSAEQILPDSGRYKMRFTIRSETSNSLYMVSFDTAGPYWVCSCRGCIGHGHCKHLEAMGLKGRSYGKNEPENRTYLRQLTVGIR